MSSWTGKEPAGRGHSKRRRAGTGANVNGSLMVSTADRMEKMDGPQLFGGFEAGEGFTGGAEFDSSSDLTLQGGLGVGGNISEVGPVFFYGVKLNHVRRWKWLTWGD